MVECIVALFCSYSAYNREPVALLAGKSVPPAAFKHAPEVGPEVYKVRCMTRGRGAMSNGDGD